MEKITIQATIAADIQKVWNYYTEPAHITQWNFATDDWQCPSASNDMKVGGKYIARMEAKDGSFGFDFEATYNAIVEKEYFSYTMPDSRTVAVTFNALPNNTTSIDIIFDAETSNPIEIQRDGWLAILNNFKNYTEHN
ncbi:MAG: SRPBCC family protein [Sphingobacteriales bacterium]|jgi:uncharacterized protein YndB with AHSA1/START domain|nr:MAG: SRPBCC family protein [Sphingobacteriales bacterium]